MNPKTKALKEKKMTIRGKYGDYEVTPEQYKSWEEANRKREHKSLLRAVRKEFPNLKFNGKKI